LGQGGGGKGWWGWGGIIKCKNNYDKVGRHVVHQKRSWLREIPNWIITVANIMGITPIDCTFELISDLHQYLNSSSSSSSSNYSSSRSSNSSITTTFSNSILLLLLLLLFRYKHV